MKIAVFLAISIIMLAVGYQAGTSVGVSFFEETNVVIDSHILKAQHQCLQDQDIDCLKRALQKKYMFNSSKAAALLEEGWFLRDRERLVAHLEWLEARQNEINKASQ